MKLAITVCATESYQYAMLQQAEHVQQALGGLSFTEGHIIIVTDEKPIPGILAHYRQLLGDAWKLHHIPLSNLGEFQNYKQQAQLVIARMRSVAFQKARALGVDFCWSLDSDVLPPANGLLCMLQMLEFDRGYYGVATCPYPSQGGGAFLFGRGTPTNPICEDFTEEERDLTPELKQALADHRAKLKTLQPGESPGQEWIDEMQKLGEQVKQSPPVGNIWEVTAKFGWRKRGWSDAAYPAIGKGSIVPSDWCGFGCTLMNKQALNLASFTGYDGAGTEDLMIVWKCWHPNNIRIAAIPHCVAHHVIRNKEKPGYSLVYVYHEQPGVECEGHLRQRQIPWQPA